MPTAAVRLIVVPVVVLAGAPGWDVAGKVGGRGAVGVEHTGQQAEPYRQVEREVSRVDSVPVELAPGRLAEWQRA